MCVLKICGSLKAVAEDFCFCKILCKFLIPRKFFHYIFVVRDFFVSGISCVLLDTKSREAVEYSCLGLKFDKTALFWSKKSQKMADSCGFAVVLWAGRVVFTLFFCCFAYFLVLRHYDDRCYNACERKILWEKYN